MNNLEGKIAIVTGGASGQGEAIVRRFISEGASVLIGDVNDAAGSALAQELGPQALFEMLDVASVSNWTKAVDSCLSTFGGVNVLINNAGVFKPKSLQDTTPEEWSLHISVNMTGIFLGMRSVIDPMMAADGGVIINTSSNAALRGLPNMFAYASSKWGVRGMSKAAAMDLAQYNIRVNCVLPGIIDTEMYRSNGPELCAELDKLIPLGRRGQPSDIAELMTFLASERAAYFSGAELTMDGALFT